MSHLLMIDVQGTRISDEEKALLQHPNVGALLLFSHNFTDLHQLKSLVNTVRVLRDDLFIAVDHEGGIVQRFQRHGLRALPAARVYGDVYDLHPETGLTLAKQYGELMATDLLTSGIDLSIAPVLDVHGVSEVIAKLDRAFHADPVVVGELAAAFIHGMNQAGMPAVGKHFPGHGSILADSHISMPVATMSAEELQNRDLQPFIHLINQQLLSALMPAHVTYSAIDAHRPVGFSKIWLQTILREQLQFNGFILSDCLSMTGADIGNLTTRVDEALTAGCDMVIVSHQPRERVAELLDTVTYKPSSDAITRLKTFKQAMKRFSSAKQDMVSEKEVSSLNVGSGPGPGPLGANKELNTTTRV